MQARRRLWRCRVPNSVNSAAYGNRESAADRVGGSFEQEILNRYCRGSLYHNMEANGIPIMALVDSGSTISMIHPSVLDRIQRGHDVTRCWTGSNGDMKWHGVGQDPTGTWCYTCRWHGTTARWRRQNCGNPWGSTTELESWYGPFTVMLHLSVTWDNCALKTAEQWKPMG